jgi:hypothetical protein
VFRLILPDDLPQIASVDALVAGRAGIKMVTIIIWLIAMASADDRRPKVR